MDFARLVHPILEGFLLLLIEQLYNALNSVLENQYKIENVKGYDIDILQITKVKL